jgi:hypothetical protein
MTQKMTSTPTGTGKKGAGFLRALGDLCILGLLLTAAGGGGYFWGLHQQLAPVEKVGPGTPGAVQPAGSSSLPPPKNEQSTSKKESKETKESKESKESGEIGTTKSTKSDSSDSADSSSSGDEGSNKHAAKKYWLTSSGADYVGYSITVKVNGNPVDSFFGPGKIVDVTQLVKAGDNVVTCDSKNLGDQYNKHIGDGSSVLTLQLVAAPHMTDTFKKSDVVLSYKRSATDSESSTDTFHFKKE